MEQRKTAGRPELLPDERRDKRLQVRVTDTELKTLNQRAKAVGMKPAEYVRKLLELEA